MSSDADKLHIKNTEGEPKTQIDNQLPEAQTRITNREDIARDIVDDPNRLKPEKE